MALMGVQLVVSLLVASLMQKMAPHWSFARWLLCNGSLRRYKHPSEEELFALAGKQKPKAKRDRRMNGVTDEKPLSVPRDIDLRLETSPITTIDALVLRYFLEYQWYVDFALYSTFIYLFTEGYYCLVDPRKEANIGILWCLLTVIFSVKIFFMVMRHYFRSEEGGERSVCLSFAFFFLLIAMIVLVIREDYLEFGLDRGLTNVNDNLEVFLMEQGWEWTIPVTKLSVRLGLVALCSFIGACLTFPGLRLAQTHLDALKMAADRPMVQLLLHASFLAPVIVVLMWIKPISRDLLLHSPMGKQTMQLMSDATYNSFRLWMIVALCVLRLAVTRLHLQAYLNLAERWVEQMKREAGRITVLEIQRKITRIYCYVTVVSLQYLGPIILTLHCTLLLKTLGEYSWGLYPESAPKSPAVDTVPVLQATPSAESGTEDIQATVQQITGALGALSAVFTPLFYRGLLSFLTWWVAVCQVVSSLFGLYFHQYLAAS
ncbi:transmembrane protein 161A isoform X1 [Hemicordylus capensis]|uniref:transmembrane protein 161A isoform X1 n=1 Tax=Hemicordylus capensis TaxID=884348 RepID=UPI00230399F4|nr:transmembrane protein 161A isoform X1 [Hemicordylus capensis]